MIDWSKYPNFKADEFRCKCGCGADGIKEELVAKLQVMRTAYGKPMKINSGYRCPRHPIEAKKSTPGAHSLGIAADIGVQGPEAYRILALAVQQCFTGIGVQQKKGVEPFIHVDIRNGELPGPTVWSY
jgi:zinc D-Ala-D-Ala carboxypeptidase